MPRSTITLAGALAALTLLAGCGAGAATEPTAGLTPAAGDAAFIDFTRCMRSHGIAMHDPFHRPGHSGLTLDMPTQSPAVAAAMKGCGHVIAAIVAMKQAHTRVIAPAERLGLIHYAECMRGHGVSMLDPGPDGQLNLGTVPGIADGVGRYTPQFRVADRACRPLLPAGLADNGTGP